MLSWPVAGAWLLAIAEPPIVKVWMEVDCPSRATDAARVKITTENAESTDRSRREAKVFIFSSRVTKA